MILFTVYLASLVYTLATRKPAAGLEAARAECEPGPPPPGGPERWSRKKALGILAVVTTVLAVVSEILTDAIAPATRSLGLTPIFAGVILLPLAGNVVEMFNAVKFARGDKMDLALGLTVGASIQVALVVAPILVFGGYFFKCDMDLLFNRFEIIAIAFAVLLTRQLIVDGQSNWFEGLLLVAVYLMLGFGFYYLPAQADTL